jgi:AcrR family transcriptional regulator
MARRSEHSLDEIKSMVLRAAESIVREQGFTSVTVRKIAHDIGYSIGSVYMVFENMDDLMNHVKASTLQLLAAQLKRAVKGEADAEQALLKLAVAYLTFAQKHFNAWSMIFEHRAAEGGPLPAWYRRHIDEIFQYPRQAFRALTPAVSDAEIDRAARAYWGGVHGICMLSLTGKMPGDDSSDTLRESVMLLAGNFIRGWCGPVNPSANAAKSAVLQ